MNFWTMVDWMQAHNVGEWTFVGYMSIQFFVDAYKWGSRH